ncbi:hypothetical protein T08_4860 [Trichinella sp. T8]|nr:hypothetical protein T08_4860 [Trichinella sp. T8]
MLYFIVEVCICNAFLLMRHKQSYRKTKKRFMRELLAGQTHQNKISKSKIYAETKHAFIRHRLPQNHEYEKIHQNAEDKDVNEINVKPLPFIQVPGLRFSAIYGIKNKFKNKLQLSNILRIKLTRVSGDVEEVISQNRKQVYCSHTPHYAFDK